ncbi:hypothetical protein AMTR_s00011p00191260 [Amborella trichopoda]|uniref:Jasmonate O-methyltransferase n=2 Tax=Amborella trichopoda TaxID=13333 RepID=W1NGL4_AMBTC|nr:hypothetical protein AMTR_s00011p00191260 [Amborella trichopoda]
MNGGAAKTSYACNSSYQRRGLDMLMPITEKVVMDVLSTHLGESMKIADLGCSSGPNTFLVLTTMVRAVATKVRLGFRPMPEIQLYLNDLPGNDFNWLFRALPSFHERLREEGAFGSCFVAGVPGSFYGRLFPSNSLHLVHSSYALHWLSKVPSALYNEEGIPFNKGNIYISESSPSCVPRAYYQQFQKDFSLYLKLRSQEVVTGGRMVLILFGRRTVDPYDKEGAFIWEALSRAVRDLILHGYIDEEKLHSFDPPYYTPCGGEVVQEVKREGSFTLERFEQVEKSPCGINGNGKDMALAMRAVMEPLIIHHFGEGIMDMLFEAYARHVAVEMAKGYKKIHLVLVLKKIK